MKLSLNEIKAVTSGAVRFFEKDGAISFSRFTEKEEAIYSYDEGKRLRAISTPGIRLWFKTDATELNLGILVREKARPYFSVEVFSNEEFIGEIKKHPDNLPNGKYPGEEFPIGAYEKSFALGDGEKLIKIILPGTVKTELSYLELSGESYAEPFKFKKKALVYGDSITQGFDALNPSRVFSVRLCDYLDADGINKAVGGAVYNPELPKSETFSDIDYVFGAYGINDWIMGTDKETYTANCRGFWESICKKYQSAKKYLITPIWAKLWEEEKTMGNLSDMHRITEEAVSGLPGIQIINGLELVSHNKDLFGDENIHPNSLGFDEYFKNLKTKLDLN